MAGQQLAQQALRFILAAAKLAEVDIAKARIGCKAHWGLVTDSGDAGNKKL